MLTFVKIKKNNWSPSILSTKFKHYYYIIKSAHCTSMKICIVERPVGSRDVGKGERGIMRHSDTLYICKPHSGHNSELNKMKVLS